MLSLSIVHQIVKNNKKASIFLVKVLWIGLGSGLGLGLGLGLGPKVVFWAV